MEVVLTT